MADHDEIDALRARVATLTQENQGLREREAHLEECRDADRFAADMLRDDITGQDTEDSYIYGCGEYDTVDSKGMPLINGGRTCNDAGEPYWM